MDRNGPSTRSWWSSSGLEAKRYIVSPLKWGVEALLAVHCVKSKVYSASLGLQGGEQSNAPWRLRRGPLGGFGLGGANCRPVLLGHKLGSDQPCLGRLSEVFYFYFIRCMNIQWPREHHWGCVPAHFMMYFTTKYIYFCYIELLSLHIQNIASSIDIKHLQEARFSANSCFCYGHMILSAIPQNTSLTLTFFHLLTLSRPFPSHLEMFYARALPSQRQHSYRFELKPSPDPCWLMRGKMSFNEQDEKRMWNSETVIPTQFH